MTPTQPGSDTDGAREPLREAQLTQRINDLYANDPQFAGAQPCETVTAALQQPRVRLREIVRIVMEGYAERPALGERATQFIDDPETGRTSVELLPRFETITYKELWDRVRAVASALEGYPAHLVRPGGRVCLLGFASIDYTVLQLALVQLGAVTVPLQTSAPVAQLRPIVAETEPSVIAASIDYLADAVELVLTGHVPTRLVVFDFHPELDDQRKTFTSARERLAEAGLSPSIITMTGLLEGGNAVPAPRVTIPEEDDPLALLIYTSGSTGAPKGAMYPERLVAGYWRPTKTASSRHGDQPWITLIFMPMSHGMGPSTLYGTLGHGGTAYFSAKSDLSTFLEDLALVRPTRLDFVPRIWDMLFQEVQREVDRRSCGDADRAAVEAQVKTEQRQSLLGGRFVSAMTGSAPTSQEMKAFVESYLDIHLTEGYGSTETPGGILVDGQVRRPPVIDYKLRDVPELGYFDTDRPHPRGELVVKTERLIPGYYNRPDVTAEMFDAEGYYRTGDIMAEVGPDRLVYLDRRNNVLKLSQGEFVAVSKLEAVLGDSPLVRQIYIYGNSARAYLLAVVVPTEDALSRSGGDVESLKPLISDALQDVARAAGLQSYEVPREIIVETTPFTVENGLLTGIRKLARPKLKERYSERLEQLYAELAEGQVNVLRALRQGGGDDRPVLETVGRAAAAVLSTTARGPLGDAHFTDLGGDSLSALTFANLLREIFNIDVPVGLIVSPATDLRAIADYIEAERSGGTKGPSFASVHGRQATEVHAGDLTLDKFLDAKTLEAAPTLPRPSSEVRTVLLTGATGFLGRYLALQWLERMSLVGGKLICLVRGKDDASARARIDSVFNSGDPQLLTHYQELASAHLEVIAGDKGQPNLGLDQRIWQQLADTVDLIVDPAALVNHVLPYSELFGPNALGTAELIRIALTTKLKRFSYVSTIGVGRQITPSAFTEDADIRAISPTRKIDDSYANGYANSKWAGEVLLREAHDLCGLPVSVFRCDMILADTRYAGQLNLPDTFTRMMLSLVATGVAPASFYQTDADGNRQRAHYDGLPVGFIAEAISTMGERLVEGFETYHVLNPYDDGIGLDEYVDWLIDAGYSIKRIRGYAEWLQRFETALWALPDWQRRRSLLPLLHNYQRPQKPICVPIAPTDRFRSAVQDAKIGADKDIPHVSAPIIVKYVTDLQLLGLL
jgi:fatty acid CoA ligase FadD9